MNTLRKYWITDAFIFLLIFAFGLSYALNRHFPFIYDDEYGVLGAAATFAGLEWDTPENMPFYGFFLSLFIFPLYWLDLEPTDLYRIVLSINALFVSLAALLALKIIRLLSVTDKESILILSVVAGFSFPSVLLYSQLAMGEATLLFCFFFIAYYLTLMIKGYDSQAYIAISLGVGIGISQYVHSRGIAFAIAFIITIICALRLHAISKRQVVITLLSVIVTVLIFNQLKGYLLSSFYGPIVRNASVIDFLASKFQDLSLESVIIAIQVFVGQLSYYFSSTFGLILPGLAILLFTAWKLISTSVFRKDKCCDNPNICAVGLISIFILIAFFTLLTVSVVQFLSPIRADHYFYGRYVEVLLPALVIISIIFLYRLPKIRSFLWLLIGFICTLTLIYIVKQYPDYIFNKTTYWTPISSWLIYIHGEWRINPQFIFLGVLSGIVVLSISYLFYAKLFIIALIGFYISIISYNFNTHYRGADQSWYYLYELAKKIGNNALDKKLVVVADKSTKWAKSEALQFSLPKAKVSFGEVEMGSQYTILDYTGKYCNDLNAYINYDKARVCSVYKNSNIKSFNKKPDSQTNSKQSVPLPPIRIDISNRTKGDVVYLGAIDRFCGLLSNYYFTYWFRYCLPFIDIKLTQSAKSVYENKILGIYISSSSGGRLHEWRVNLDLKQLANNGYLHVNTPIMLPPNITRGTYLLNIAIVDSNGWDIREIRKIRLEVK